MAYNPGVSFFIPFHELDPSRDSQCIFFTQKGARCRWSCQENDNRNAIVLHKTLHACPSETVTLDQLRKYILYICCRSGRAQHQDRIEDIGLLIPLAQRWHDEIRKRAAAQSNSSNSFPALEQTISTISTYPTPTTTTSNDTIALYSRNSSPPYHKHNTSTPSKLNPTISESVASPPHYQFGFLTSSTTIEFTFQLPGSQPHYNLPPREASTSFSSASASATFIRQEMPSEFRPHIANPQPRDTVGWKILDPLEDRDFEIGRIYIFDRESSPGHVKIGWTARSVEARLMDWSRCGYEPRLLFETEPVPHAQRAELLTHYELIKEWRRERMCKASWCRKSHQEWFETSEERAEQVLGKWADFMKKAEPYGSDGLFKDHWRMVVENMNRNGELVTGKKLLEHYERSLVDDTTLVLKIEEPARCKEAPKFKIETMAEQILPVESPISKAEENQQNYPPSKMEPLPKTESVIKTKPRPSTESLFTGQVPSNIELLLRPEPLVKWKPPLKNMGLTKTTLFNVELSPETQFLFKTELQLEMEPLSKPEPIVKVESQFKSASLFKTDSLIETKHLPRSQLLDEVSAAPETAPVKELTPSQIPLPPSPLVQPTILPQDAFSTTSADASPVKSSNPSFEEPIDPLDTPVSQSEEEQNETDATLTSTTLRQRNVKGDEHAEPESGISKYEGQPSEATITSHGQDETITAETKPGTEADGWDTEETLVEDQISRCLEEAALEVIEGLSNEISAGKVNGNLNDLDGLKMVETEATRAVEVVVQA